MSEADKMFEELGYVCKEEDGMLIYLNENGADISFGLDKHFVYVGEEMNAMWIDMKELKAINKKCEELGWI